MTTRRSLFASLAIASLLVIAGCGDGGTTITDPPPDTLPDTTNGGVQKASLSILVLIAPEDARAAQLLGWQEGIPGATVTIRRAGPGEVPLEGSSDAVGRVSFAELLPGTYSISVFRELNAQERGRLDEEFADVNALGGGRNVSVQAPTADATVNVIAGRRGGLVFSEFFGYYAVLSSGWEYPYGHYIEITNNSDQVQFLGSKVIALGIPWVTDGQDPLSCQGMAEWREDSNGIWTGYRYKFPGSSGSYPLAPGKSVIVATEALNHADFVPGLINLSGADFEFEGSSGVDNPTVPNVTNMGPREYGLEKRGQHLPILHQVWVLADAVTENELPRADLPVVNPEHRMIPAEKILDVFATTVTPEVQAGLSTVPCDRIVDQRFDGQHAAIFDAYNFASMKRRVSATLPDGRVILQRTRTSARDFDTGPPTPGTIP